MLKVRRIPTHAAVSLARSALMPGTLRMPLLMEIERKFLVIPEKVPRLPKGNLIEQGYLVFQNPPSVPVELRIRRVNEADCFLTIKSGSTPSRLEVEWAIGKDQFARLWAFTEGRRILKRRHRISLENHLTAELDIYEGHQAGLQTVEVEFSSEAEASAFTPPGWFGTEVTRDKRYANAELAG
jgi:adenylate cyclase